MPLELIGNPSFIATFDVDKNVDYIDEALTDASATTTLSGAGASVAGGLLILDPLLSAQSQLVLDADLMDGIAQAGCIRFKARFADPPGVSDSAVRLFEWFSISESSDNAMWLDLTETGLLLKITVHNGAADAVSIDAAFTFVPDQDYIIEIDFDVSAGATRVFVDGVQVGSTSGGTRNTFAGSGANTLHIGTDGNGPSGATGVTDTRIDYFAVWPTVQHAANHTPNLEFPKGSGYGTDPLPSVPKGLITYTKGSRYRSCGRNT